MRQGHAGPLAPHTQWAVGRPDICTILDRWLAMRTAAFNRRQTTDTNSWLPRLNCKQGVHTRRTAPNCNISLYPRAQKAHKRTTHNPPAIKPQESAAQQHTQSTNAHTTCDLVQSPRRSGCNHTGTPIWEPSGDRTPLQGRGSAHNAHE